MTSLEETLVHSFLVLDYASPTFFKRSYSITKTLVRFFGDTEEYEEKLKEIENHCAGLLRTNSGRQFALSYTVLEQSHMSNYGRPPDTPIEFEITHPDGMMEIYGLSLMDITTYLYLLHDRLLDIVLEMSKKHGISLGDLASGFGPSADNKALNAPSLENQRSVLPEL